MRARDSRTKSPKPWRRRSVRPLQYTWANSRGRGGFPEFLALTLDAKKCDVVMGLPYGNREELTTQPYYVSSYVFVFKKSKNYDIKSMDSPILQKIKIGLEGDTPVEDGVKIRGMLTRAKVFDVASTAGESPATMLDALDKGQIDVLITWEPAIGRFLSRYRDLDVVAVPNARTLGAPEQYVFPISMGVRQGDEALQKAARSSNPRSPVGAHGDLDPARRQAVYTVADTSRHPDGYHALWA